MFKVIGSSFNVGIFIVESSNKKGVEETISADKEAFKASVPSLAVTPFPKKEAAKPDKPAALLLPISGERVTLTVYCLGTLNAIIRPIIPPIPTALYIVLRKLIILRTISFKSISIISSLDLLDSKDNLLSIRWSVIRI